MTLADTPPGVAGRLSFHGVAPKRHASAVRVRFSPVRCASPSLLRAGWAGTPARLGAAAVPERGLAVPAAGLPFESAHVVPAVQDLPDDLLGIAERFGHLGHRAGDLVSHPYKVPAGS